MDSYVKIKSVFKVIDLVMFDKEIKHKGKAIRKRLKELPTEDVVSREVLEQVKWERDTALKTLEEHGIGLGEKKEGAEK
jgi:hypothetical protein